MRSFAEVFDMIAGGTDFRLSIDRHTGILLRVMKFVDNELAEPCEFTEITIDEPLDDALFAPLLLAAADGSIKAATVTGSWTGDNTRKDLVKARVRAVC